MKNLYGYKLVRAGKRSELKHYRRNHKKQRKLFPSFNEWEQVRKEIKKKKQTFP